MTYNRLQGPYSQRRYSNAATTPTSGTGTGTGGGTGKHRVVTTANDRSMGDVKLNIIKGGFSVNPNSDTSQQQYSRFTAQTGQMFAHGTQLRITAQPASGYEFVSWNEVSGNNKTNPSFVFTVDRDMTFTANFRKVHVDTIFNVKVSWDAQMGRVTPNGSYNLTNGGIISVHSGDSITLTATPDEGYSFVRWEGVNLGGNQQSNKSKTITLTVAHDYNLTAVFAKNNPTDGSNPPGNGDPNDPNDPDAGGGGSGGGGGVIEDIIEPPVLPAGASTMDTIIAYAKKYWWALAIIAYVIYKETKK